jgi:hypothetical protein
MNFETRIFFIIQLFFFKFEEKFLFLQKIFSIALFSLFFGFLIANIFGSFLNVLRNFIIWDGFIILFLILFIEFINSIIYNNKNRSSIFFNFVKFIFKSRDKKSYLKPPFSWFFKKVYLTNFQPNKPQNLNFDNNIDENLNFSKKNLKEIKNLPFWKILNYFKLGIMLGFFIDAFKVGS